MKCTTSRSLFLFLAVPLAGFLLLGAAPQDSSQEAEDDIRTLVSRLSLEQYKATLKGLTQFGDRRQGTKRNRDAIDWFVGSIWPAVRQALPRGRLHVFGNLARAAPGVEVHPPPADSSELFVPGSVLVVPLRIASGVRIKILEAWSRGVPVAW